MPNPLIGHAAGETSHLQSIHCSSTPGGLLCSGLWCAPQTAFTIDQRQPLNLKRERMW